MAGGVMATRRALLLAAGGLLGGCGFSPLLREPGKDVREDLASVEVEGLGGGRLEQQLRIALQDQLNPTALRLPTRYRLQVDLRRDSDALAIQLDNTITRYNLELRAAFRLIRSDDSAVVYRSRVRRITSYNVLLEPFATLISEQDAERRVAEEVGANIGTLLAAYFARQASDA